LAVSVLRRHRGGAVLLRSGDGALRPARAAARALDARGGLGDPARLARLRVDQLVASLAVVGDRGAVPRIAGRDLSLLLAVLGPDGADLRPDDRRDDRARAGDPPRRAPLPHGDGVGARLDGAPVDRQRDVQPEARPMAWPQLADAVAGDQRRAARV